MAFTFPSAQNVHVNVPLTNFAVDLRRDRNRFATELLCPSFQVNKISDKFWKFDHVEAFRRVGAEDNKWPIGKRSEPNTAEIQKDLDDYTCQRYARQAVVPYEVRDNADFEYTQKEVDTLVSLLQMEKMIQAIDTIVNGLTASTVTGDLQTATSTALFWNNSTTVDPAIRIGINHSVRTIHENSYGTVDPKNLWLVVNPELAHKMSQTQEMIDYIKQSPTTLMSITNASEFSNAQWFGLPPVLFGVNVFICDVRKLTSEEGATDVSAYLIDNDTALFVNVEPPSLKTYGTAVCFEYEPMTISTFDIPWQRNLLIQAVSNWDIKLTASLSAYKLTDTHS